MSDSHDHAIARSQARRRRRIDHADLARQREQDFYIRISTRHTESYTHTMHRYYPRPGSHLPQTDGPGSRQASPSPGSKSQTPPSTPPPSLDYAAPRASDDKALTAFAQLGALRLNARRCLISFFDRNDCFLLAEATRTLSLQSGEPEFEDDRLAFGTTIFPKEQSLCNYTVNLAPKYSTLPLDDPSDLPHLVVNDLSKDKRFCNFPFVKGPPYSRFYAGVPIRSPSGHSIGTYCVLDENPRNGLTPHQLAFLKSMAGTVMRHLERTRAAEDHRRAKIMVKSLGSFAEGKSGLENWAQDPWDVDTQVSGLPDVILPQRQRPAATSDAAQQPVVLNGYDHVDPGMKNPNDTPPLSSVPPSIANVEASDSMRPEITTTTSSTSTKGFTKTDQKDRVAPELRAHFTRAANMIVDSTEAEGVAFFDAKISTFGGLVDDDFDPDQLPEPDKPCDILGAALCRTDRDTKPLPNTGECISESVLRHLLRLYPHGQIFHLDDDPASPSVNSPSTGVSIDEVESADGFPFSTPRKTESTRSLDDEAYLRRVFPTARSLILYPLWDPHRERWFATAVIWSSEPKRIFTTEQELSYLAAFSNFVMAEVARLDTKLADAAKADFISSISHELRSPLHGILGMTDLLKDSSLDGQQVSHLATIETCGKTLLETINHVLDFAKINNLTRGVSKRQKKRTQSAKHMISPGQAHTNDIMTLINDVDMSILTEDVVESVFAGYTYAKTSAQTYELTTSKVNKPPISIILDINHSDNYVFRTQPGAWRRVIMNLFGNSLKYTPGGYIKVKLEVKRKPEDDDECEFRFSVTDSGIGMSEDYINNRLFHSFAQENPLSQGTGLGLSIVKQIVESLGGEVEVRSEKERGTKFTVTCPLKETRMSPNVCATGLEGEKDLQLQQITKRTKGLKVRFEGFHEEEEFRVRDLKNKTASKLSLKALDSLCDEWFGIERCEDGDNASEPDLIIATETCAKGLRTTYSQNPGKVSPTPVIVICQGAAAAQSTTAITVPGIIFECIGQPVGPHKMAKALASCLDRHAKRAETQLQPHKIDSVIPRITELNLTEERPASAPRRTDHLHVVESSRPQLTSISSAPEIRSLHNTTPPKASKYLKPTRALRCLCVDDNPINLRLLRTFVDKLGHHHVLAADGLEALESYKAATVANDGEAATEESRIDVVLMDINMPVMDGLEATRQIRAHEIRNNLPKVTIIALTGVADTDIQQEANSSGINLFLIKPVRLADLEVILKGVVTGQDKANLEIEAEKERLKLVEQEAIFKSTVESVDEKARGINVGVAVVQGEDEVVKKVKVCETQTQQHKKSASIV